MTEEQKKKRRFRNSKKWKEFRHLKNVEQHGLDYITRKKLYKQANVHHMDLNPDNYDKLENTENFVYLNKMTHDVVHFLYGYYCDDRDVIKRLVEVLDKMISINK